MQLTVACLIFERIWMNEGGWTQKDRCMGHVINIAAQWILKCEAVPEGTLQQPRPQSVRYWVLEMTPRIVSNISASKLVSEASDAIYCYNDI